MDTKSKRGRPPLADDEKKNYGTPIYLRPSPEQREEIAAAALRASQTISEWAISQLVRAARRK